VKRIEDTISVSKIVETLDIASREISEAIGAKPKES
jgi:hypothetical protein